MKASTAAQLLHIYSASSKIFKIINFAEKHPEKQAVLAVKEFRRLLVLTFLFVIFIILPIIAAGVYLMIYGGRPKLPEGAVRRVGGRVEWADDTFYYLEDSKRYDFDRKDYHVDESYKKGELIDIFLDADNQVVSVAHDKGEPHIITSLLLMLVAPVIVLVLFSIIIGKTLARNYGLYVRWYEEEIEPYEFQENFEEIVADKRYYDVIAAVKAAVNSLSEEKQRQYKKYRNKFAVLLVLFLSGLVGLICLGGVIGMEGTAGYLVKALIVVYVVIFWVMMDNCSVEMRRIRTGYYDKQNKEL